MSGLQDSLPVETVSHSNVISGSTRLYKVLRDYLVLQSHHYNPHPGKNYVSYGVGYSFFTHQEDRDYEIECLNSLRKPVRHEPSGASQSGIAQHRLHNLVTKIAPRIPNVK